MNIKLSSLFMLSHSCEVYIMKNPFHAVRKPDIQLPCFSKIIKEQRCNPSIVKKHTANGQESNRSAKKY